MSEELAARRCKPCEGGTEPLTPEQAEELLRALHADWSLSEDGLASRGVSVFRPTTRH